MENPTIKKLRIKEGMCVAIINSPPAYIKSLGKLPKNVKVEAAPKGLCDLVQLFVRNKTELNKIAPAAIKLLKPHAAFWISYPKKSSAIETDLSRDESWKIMSEMNFEGVSLIALDETWSAGRFKFIEGKVSGMGVRTTERSKEDLKYIDVEKRVITFPADLKVAFEKNKEAHNFFETLSFTNRKEYVRWIIDAKREETRKERVGKTIEKLLKGKKNPAEK
jgi:hypothetical protein